MRELFLQGFTDDLETIEKRVRKGNLFDNKKALEIHDIFWDSLDVEQKDKYRNFEMVLGEERLIIEENIYLFALKKGIAMGYEIAKQFK